MLSLKNIFLRLLLLSLLSPLFLWLGWPPLHFSFLLFLALVPLLVVEDQIRAHKLSFWKYFLIVYLSLFLWNVLSTYWIYKTSIKGALLIHLLNPLLLTIPFIFYHLSKRYFSALKSDMLFISSWIALEYFHHNWQFAFPFLTLGNGLSSYPQLVQFYEYTGVLGGSLWILVGNIVFFHLFQNKLSLVKNRFPENARAIFLPLLLLSVPGILSCYIFAAYEENGKAVQIVAIHPNIDCRNEKYKINGDTLVMRYIKYSLQKITTETDYIVWPENAITNSQWINTINNQKVFQLIRTHLLDKYPKAKLVSGAILYEQYNEASLEPGTAPSLNLRYDSINNKWYHTYNSAVQLNSQDLNVSIRTKTKLVPIEETIPYSKEFAFLRKIVRSLGGFSFETRPYNNDVFDSNNGIKVTPLICYESIFGNLVADYVKRGATLLFVILNEGWYKDMTGASQFMYYSSLRAIENRRSIARSSNDGITCFINQKGEVANVTRDYKGTSINGILYANRKKTIYTIYGDYLGLISLTICLVLIPLLGSKILRKK